VSSIITPAVVDFDTAAHRDYAKQWNILRQNVYSEARAALRELNPHFLNLDPKMQPQQRDYRERLHAIIVQIKLIPLHVTPNSVFSERTQVGHLKGAIDNFKLEIERARRFVPSSKLKKRKDNRKGSGDTTIIQIQGLLTEGQTPKDIKKNTGASLSFISEVKTGKRKPTGGK
jgi:hypothetical protein